MKIMGETWKSKGGARQAPVAGRVADMPEGAFKCVPFGDEGAWNEAGRRRQMEMRCARKTRKVFDGCDIRLWIGRGIAA